MVFNNAQAFDNLFHPEVTEGDLLLGLGSCGVRTESFALDLDTLCVDKSVLDTRITELGCTIGEELQKPPRNYDHVLNNLYRRNFNPKASVLITGSLHRNLPDILPAGLTARIHTASFPVPPIFDFISLHSKLSEQEMFKHFNMGIGMVLIISRQEVGQIKNALCCCGERAYIIGCVVKGDSMIDLM